MSTVSAVNGSNTYSVDGAGGIAGLSPDALLEYCQTQLGGLDTEIKNSIKQQNLALQEREAAEQAQGVLEQFGDSGPTDAPGMQKCVDALNNAISSLPPGDPVAANLQKFETNMCNQYNFTPGRALTGDEERQYAIEMTTPANSGPYGSGGSVNTVPFDLHGKAPPSVGEFQKIMTGTLGTPPQNNDWKGTCEALGNIVGDIKSGAEIQMLQLQDLVSQRQQAVSLACGMMSKEDSSLEQLARLGQG
jgi:hypothetical protein